MVILEFDLNDNKTKNGYIVLLQLKASDAVGLDGSWSSSRKWRFSLEREKLLSKISRNPTVGSLRDKKENCSTRRGLRVGTEFKEFRKTP